VVAYNCEFLTELNRVGARGTRGGEESVGGGFFSLAKTDKIAEVVSEGKGKKFFELFSGIFVIMICRATEYKCLREPGCWIGGICVGVDEWRRQWLFIFFVLPTMPHHTTHVTFPTS